MTHYTVSTEIKTPWYLKLGRFFRLIKPRKVFTLTLAGAHFWPGELLYSCDGHIIIISKV